MATRTKSPLLTVEQSKAVAAFLHAWGVTWAGRPGRLRWVTHISRPQIARLAEGDTSVSSSIIARVVRQAADWAAAQDEERYTWYRPLTDEERTRLLAAVDALGADSRALFDTEYLCRRAEYIERQSSPAASAPVGDFTVPAGMSLAPFLSSEGEPMVLAIGRGYALLLMAAVETRGGWNYVRDEDERIVRQTLRPDTPLGPSVEHFTKLLPEGVHAAPWRPHGHPDGGAWVVIDRDHRLVAIMDYDSLSAARSARQDALALLDMARERYCTTEPLPDAPSSGWRDPYNDGNKTDIDDCGEDWKR